MNYSTNLGLMNKAMLYKISSSFAHAKEVGIDPHLNRITVPTTENGNFFLKIIPESVKSIAVPMLVNQRSCRESDEVQIKLKNIRAEDDMSFVQENDEQIYSDFYNL